MSETNLVYWICESCKSLHISNKKVRHSMDWCDCRKSAVDAEEFYIRGIGEAKTLTKEQWEAIRK